MEMKINVSQKLQEIEFGDCIVNNGSGITSFYMVVKQDDNQHTSFENCLLNLETGKIDVCYASISSLINDLDDFELIKSKNLTFNIKKD